MSIYFHIQIFSSFLLCWNLAVAASVMDRIARFTFYTLRAGRGNEKGTHDSITVFIFNNKSFILNLSVRNRNIEAFAIARSPSSTQRLSRALTLP